MKYFTETGRDVPTIKKEYRRLAHLLHPDKGGDVVEMQRLNSEYLEALRLADGSSYKDEDKVYTYTYNESTEIEIINKLQELLTNNIDKIANIFLIGSWVWVLDTKKEDREKLKELKLRWSGQRRAWYFHTGKYRTFSSKRGLQSIANKYGAGKVFRDVSTGLIKA
jgi:hypothetical protein